MKNKESRKIGLTFLGFFYHFLELFMPSQKKEKEKVMNSVGPNPAQPAQFKQKSGTRPCARPRWQYFTEAPDDLTNTLRTPATIYCLTDIIHKDPQNSISSPTRSLTTARSPFITDAARTGPGRRRMLSRATGGA